MLQPNANLRQIRLYLKEKIGEVYPSRETESYIQLIFNHLDLNYMASFTLPNSQSNPDIIAQINEFVEEIRKKKPIQYILGYTIFYDLKIIVTPDVLIPRPETEEMVDMILQNCALDQISILDVGSGSGCIAVALKKNLPMATVSGLERYAGALKISSLNAENNNVEIEWIRADFLNQPSEEITIKFDMIVSNPPYVTESDRSLMNPNVLDFEPWSALFVKDSDPFIFFRAMADFSKEHLNKPGEIWLELNENLGKETRNVFIEQGFKDCHLLQDMHGKDRFLHIIFK